MAPDGGPTLLEEGKAKDTTNGVVRRGRGRPRKYPLPDATGTAKDAGKNTGANKREKTDVPGTKRRRRAEGDAGGKPTFHITCTDELLNSLLEESPTIPLTTNAHGQHPSSNDVNRQRLLRCLSDHPSKGLQTIQRDTSKEFAPDNGAEPCPTREGTQRYADSQHAKAQQLPNGNPKIAVTMAEVDLLGGFQEGSNEHFWQDSATHRRAQEQNSMEKKTAGKERNTLALAVDHLRSMLQQVSATSHAVANALVVASTFLQLEKREGCTDMKVAFVCTAQSKYPDLDKEDTQGGRNDRTTDQGHQPSRKSPSMDQRDTIASDEKHMRTQEKVWTDAHENRDTARVCGAQNEYTCIDPEEMLGNCFMSEIGAFQQGMREDSAGRDHSHHSGAPEKEGTKGQNRMTRGIYTQDDPHNRWRVQEKYAEPRSHFPRSGQEDQSRTSVSLSSLLEEEKVKLLFASSGLRTDSDSSNGLMLLLKTAARLEMELQASSTQLQVARDLHRQQQAQIDKLEALCADMQEENKMLREFLEYRRNTERLTSGREIDRGIPQKAPSFVQRIQERSPMLVGTTKGLSRHTGSSTEAGQRKLDSYPLEGFP
eukprot:scaffold64_cov338-Pavlova_lutheri.AAC.57